MPQDTYKPSSGGRDSVELVYDPVTRKWVPKSSSDVKNGSGSQSPNTSTTTKTSTAVVESKSSDSKKKADKEYIEIEFNTLVGELSITSTEKSIRIRVNDTLKIDGLGKYLSGLYFVSSVRRTLDKDNGYTHTFTVIKTGFGNSLKKVQTVEPPRKPEVPKETGALKAGDKVKIVGANAIYSNAHDGVKVPAWVKQKTLTVDAVSSDGTRVRLNPIWSWTYIKYVQKV